jgi:hypothetical protein
MSLAMRLLAPDLEESTATDEGQAPSLEAESSVPIQGHGQSNLNHLDFPRGIASPLSFKKIGVRMM